jgi:hypothetical protein
MICAVAAILAIYRFVDRLWYDAVLLLPFAFFSTMWLS